MNLTIEYKKVDDQDTLILNGEVDAFTATDLKKEILDLTESTETKQLVLQMSGVSYMDSTGIGVIIAGYKSAKKNGSSLIVQGLSSRVKRLFDITGLSEIVEVKKLEEERS
jgi:anti-sigma B factor antagonist